MASDKSTTADTTVLKKVTAQAGGIDLTERMRRLSIGSDASSFSLISRTSRANSFESVRSINSDQSHEAEGLSTSPQPPPNTEVSDSTDLQNSVLSLDTVKSLEEISGGVEIPDTASEHSDAESEASSLELDENPAWSEYTNFVHRPDASFQSEFERLARTKGWVGRIKRQHLVELLTSEVEFYWGADDVDKLEYYQFLCQEMGVKQIPLTVTQAKNVSTSSMSPRKSTPLTINRRFGLSKSTFIASSTTCATRRSRSSHTRLSASFAKASARRAPFRGNVLRLVKAAWPLCCPNCNCNDLSGFARVIRHACGFSHLGISWYI